MVEVKIVCNEKFLCEAGEIATARVVESKIRSYLKSHENMEGEILIFPSLRVGREIDLVVWMSLKNGFFTFKKGLSSVRKKICNAILTIEIKQCEQRQIEFINGGLYVKYKKNPKPKSTQIQSKNQKKYLYTQLKTVLLKNNISISDGDLKIVNLIWFLNANRNPGWNLQNDNYLFKNCEGNVLFSIIRKKLIDDENKLSSLSHIALKPIEDYFKRLQNDAIHGIGQLTKTKIDAIFNNSLEVKEDFLDSIGEKFTIISGNPGTGKTFYLLNIAQKFKNKNEKVLFLTFNKALSLDIERMSQISENPLVDIRTIDSYIISTLISNGCQEIKTPESYINLSSEQKGDIIKFNKNVLLNHDYDFAFIDEAQDCYDYEIDFLTTVFSKKKLVVSLGDRQFVRDKVADWTSGLNREDIQIKKLYINKRNKKGLVFLFNEFSAQRYNFSWNLKEMDKLLGGVCHFSNTYSVKLHEDITKTLKDNKASKYDLLFIVPDCSVGSEIGDVLTNRMGESVFLFSDDDIENIKPTNQIRIVNYSICRGLEGVVVVIYHLDKIIRRLEHNSSFKEESIQKDFIQNWMLMILTRAIDKLIIIIDNGESEESRIIKDIHKKGEFGDVIVEIKG